MNEVFLIYNNFSFFVKLNFILDNNYFEIDDEIFRFEILSKDKLRIYNENINTILQTSDSFLYFEDISQKEYYKKINLIHNEWFDNAILNFRDHKVLRYKNRDQFGVFEENGDNLIINWDYWGKENFIKLDDYNYYQEKYEIINTKDLKKVNIYVFIHCCSLNNGFEILLDQINNIKESNLYDKLENIYLSLLGDFNFEHEIFKYEKIEILFYNKDVFIYEIEAMNQIRSFCDKLKEEAYILYIHTKGANNSGNKEVVRSWRKMMEFFLVNNYEKCLSYLDDYDALGNNLINNSCYNFNDIKVNNSHSKHFSGNFWWSKKSYINKLKNLEIDYSENAKYTRYRAENWILSDDDCKIGILFQDYTNTHPYHRYLFENYKDEKIVIKNEENILGC